MRETFVGVQIPRKEESESLLEAASEQFEKMSELSGLVTN
jgi:hypothetical protein